MRSVGFDYPNTCPKIDKAIDAAQDTIRRFLESLLEEACPLLPSARLPSARLSELADDNAKALYKDLEDAFETVRKANEDMRAEADSQISDLQSELADAEAQIEQLEAEAA